jgi:hypothetical protein
MDKVIGRGRGHGHDSKNPSASPIQVLKTNVGNDLTFILHILYNYILYILD